MDHYSQSPYYFGPPFQPEVPRPEPKRSPGMLFGAVALTAVLSSGLTAAIVNNQTSQAVPQSTVPAVTAAGLPEVSDSELSSVLKTVYTVAVTNGSNRGSGSGVAIDSKHIVTNAHVVNLGGEADARSSSIEVQDSAGREYEAQLVGVDAVADVAVLRLNEGQVQSISWGSSDELTIGQSVIALGAPLGLSNTVTAGIVSAIDRPVELANSSAADGAASDAATYINTIQTDAAINSGNSGGPLIDTEGRLVGLNVAISSTGGQGGSIGIGYAIPASYVQRVAQELIENGEASHGLLGVQVATAAGEGGNFENGAVVREVESNSAASGKLRSGDVISAWNGRPVASANSLIGFVKSTAPGDEAVLTVRRGERERAVTIKLASDRA